jgi:site-specific DNA-methyltransferase (adenine-specific)
VPRINGTFKSRAETPNQIPEQLVGRIIRLCSNPDDVVLDPFVGSGTTPAVAKKLGRRWIGYELNEDYCHRANTRVAASAVGAPLDTPDVQGG